MSDPYVSKARGWDPYTLYCYNVHCLDISNVSTEFNVPACVKSQNNTHKNTAPMLESRINVHGQTQEHTACKDKAKRLGPKTTNQANKQIPNDKISSVVQIQILKLLAMSRLISATMSD